MSEHKDDGCTVPFCKECLANIKRVANVARSLRKAPSNEADGLNELLMRELPELTDVEHIKLRTKIEAHVEKQKITYANQTLDRAVELADTYEVMAKLGPATQQATEVSVLQSLKKGK